MQLKSDVGLLYDKLKNIESQLNPEKIETVKKGSLSPKKYILNSNKKI